FTWGSIGIIDEPSLLAITNEAWSRTPTTKTTLVIPVNLAARSINIGGDPRVYYLAATSPLDTNQHVCELAWGGGAWSHRDVTIFAGGISGGRLLPLPGSAVAAITVGNPRVYYLAPLTPGTSSGRVCELGYRVPISPGTGGWNYTDVTKASGDYPKVLAAAPGSALTAVGVSTTSDPRVYYLGLSGTDYHVCELASGGGGWSFSDVTATSSGESAVSADPRSPLAALAESESLGPRVYYLSADHHVHELVWVWSAEGWRHQDITAASSGAPDAISGSPLTAIWVDGCPRVYYLGLNGTDNHVHELAGGGPWNHHDITNAGTGVPVSGSRLTVGIGTNQPRVYYLADKDVHELALGSGGGWSDSDISTGAGAPSA